MLLKAGKNHSYPLRDRRKWIRQRDIKKHGEFDVVFGVEGKTFVHIRAGAKQVNVTSNWDLVQVPEPDSVPIQNTQGREEDHEEEVRGLIKKHLPKKMITRPPWKLENPPFSSQRGSISAELKLKDGDKKTVRDVKVETGLFWSRRED